MELIRKIGQTCRVHYEKFLLTLVLLGLGASVWYVSWASSAEDEKIRQFFTDVGRQRSKPVQPVDLAEFENAMKSAQNPATLNFATPHNLFNPVRWQKRPDGTLIKIQTGTEVGWPQMVLTRVAPLNFSIALDRVVSPGAYYLGVTREAAERLVDRRKKQRFTKLNEKNDLFTLREIKGPPEDPTELVVELAASGDKVSLFKDKPYTRVEGYEAEMKYNADGQLFKNLRVGSSIKFLGDDYNIVAITENELVASARANDKKYTVRRSTSAQ